MHLDQLEQEFKMLLLVTEFPVQLTVHVYRIHNPVWNPKHKFTQIYW